MSASQPMMPLNEWVIASVQLDLFLTPNTMTNHHNMKGVEFWFICDKEKTHTHTHTCERCIGRDSTLLQTGFSGLLASLRRRSCYIHSNCLKDQLSCCDSDTQKKRMICLTTDVCLHCSMRRTRNVFNTFALKDIIIRWKMTVLALFTHPHVDPVLLFLWKEKAERLSFCSSFNKSRKWFIKLSEFGRLNVNVSLK